MQTETCDRRTRTGSAPCGKHASWKDMIPLPGGGHVTVWLCKPHSDRQWKARGIKEHAQMGSYADLVPTTWLDPLLTGKDAALPGNGPWGCPDIERLLTALKERIAAAEADSNLDGNEGNEARNSKAKPGWEQGSTPEQWRASFGKKELPGPELCNVTPCACPKLDGA